MLISYKNVAALFSISAETVAALREENASLKAELAAAKSELLSSKVNLDWLRVQFNQLQLERSALLDKLYGIRTPVPELATARPQGHLPLQEVLFEDLGDEEARKLGLPTY